MSVYGLDTGDLPEAWRPLNAIAIVECLDLDDNSPDLPGAKRLCVRSTDDLDAWTAIGMLEAVAADLKSQYVAGLEPVDGEEDP